MRAAHAGSTVANMVSKAATLEALTARVKADIHDSGLSVAELALRTGISRMTLSRRIAGSPFLSTELIDLADTLGVSVADWFKSAEAAVTADRAS